MRKKKSRSTASIGLTANDLAGDEIVADKGGKVSRFVGKRFSLFYGICLGVLSVVLLWSYWPALATLVETWDREPDYSHGFIVPLLCAFFLWARLDKFPGFTGHFAWQGLGLIVAGVALRLLAGIIYLDSLEGWSIVLWIAGAVWLVGGTRIFVWALPAIAYLLFMVPIPFRAERLLSGPLQKIATQISCFVMQCLGQPAISEGNVILLGDFPLNVEEACSGLRIFIAIFAVACAYLILVRRTWWEKSLILVGTIPIALISNACRIIATGLIAKNLSSEAANKFTHDFAGLAMIPFAAALFGLLLLYLDVLFPEIEVGNFRSIMQSKMARERRPS